ncbi:MAG: hypothetical protein DRO18_07875 [Thermoprotei archaeon]|nr:MAG: hypothetical protein DRO18_07875 [Thermoprotei archaeon]
MRRNLEDVVTDILVKYGERAFEVLKVAVDIALENRSLGKRLPGDFDFRTLAYRLHLNGIKYNPSRLLSIIEKEYGIIETTYRSSNQRWWRFTNLHGIMEILNKYELTEEVIDDPEIYLIRLQLKLLKLGELSKVINELLNKSKLLKEDEERIRELVFNELEAVVKVLKRMMKFKDRFEREINECLNVLKLMSKLVNRVVGSRVGSYLINVEEVIDEYDEYVR